jgi:hypothetical protein
MRTPLQQKASEFLELPVPKEIQYVPGSLVEVFLRAYAEGVELDPELIELAEIGAMELDGAVDAHSTSEAKTYFRDCKAILQRILDSL